MGDKIEEALSTRACERELAEAKWLFQEQLSRLVAEEGALVWEEGQGKAL